MATDTRVARIRRHRRVRKRIFGTAERPRLAVFRSNKHIYAQLIDDLSALIAEKCKVAKVEQVVFDRGGRLYHGRVAALADGAREGGLKI